ncbi:MAG: dihydroorotase [Chitinophagaceae bacterium]|nr:dihydroorotase [Chitinophagaceae bacterium]
MQVHIRKARVIDTQSDYHDKVVDLLVEEGVITKIAATIKTSADAVVEAKDLCVSPGWVDVFADYREPGTEHKETIATGLAAAAAGGFTDVLLAPNTQPALSSKSSIQYVLSRAAGNAVNLHPIGTATRNAEGKELAEMMDMRMHGAMAFSDGWKPIQNPGLMLKALEYITAFHGTMIEIPMDAALSAGGLMNEGPVSTALGMAGIPAIAETMMVYRDIELVRYTNSRLHLTGITTAASVAMIKKAKAEGLGITCSVTPYHLALTDEALRGYSSAYKVMPPLRAESDRKALIAGLKDGTIDCIASHHAPHEWDAKAKEYEYSSDGMAIQELAYNIMWDSLKNSCSIDRLVTAMSLIPRDIFGLPERSITKGSEASLTLFTTSGTTTLQANKKQSMGVNNPFLGKTLQGSVIGILNNNKLHINN